MEPEAWEYRLKVRAEVAEELAHWVGNIEGGKLKWELGHSESGYEIAILRGVRDSVHDGSLFLFEDEPYGSEELGKGNMFVIPKGSYTCFSRREL